MPATAEPLADMALPEHLRLPDLSDVRTVTEADLAGWAAAAREAFLWGPDERNGCTRHLGTAYGEWRNALGQKHCPDPHTPAVMAYPAGGGTRTDPGWARWVRSGSLHRAGNQPASIWINGLEWHPNGHRQTGLDRLHPIVGPKWRWDDEVADDDLAALLTRAWTDATLTDADARTMLDAAADLPADPDLSFIAAQQWLARVLAASRSPHLTTATSAWIALLTT